MMMMMSITDFTGFPASTVAGAASASRRLFEETSPESRGHVSGRD